MIMEKWDNKFYTVRNKLGNSDIPIFCNRDERLYSWKMQIPPDAHFHRKRCQNG